MSTPPWKDFPLNLPTDDTVVWVRPYDYYGTPFLALWDIGNQTFVDDLNGIVFPAYIIRAFRIQ